MGPERGLDALGVMRIGGYDRDARARAGDSRRARASGPDRQAGIGVRGDRDQTPAFLPLDHVSAAGADIGSKNREAGQSGAALCFFQDLGGVMSPGRQFLEVERSLIAERAELS
jgi:hypothetical protein